MNIFYLFLSFVTLIHITHSINPYLLKSKEMVVEYIKNNPLSDAGYIIRNDIKDESRLFRFNGTHVIVNKKTLEIRLNNEGNLNFTYKLLDKVLNDQQIQLCPFCGLPEIKSLVEQGYVHSKLECEEGHFDYYFSKNTLFSTHVFHYIFPIWLRQKEINRVMNKYKELGGFHGLRKMFYINKNGKEDENSSLSYLFLRRFKYELVHDLGLKNTHYQRKYI